LDLANHLSICLNTKENQENLVGFEVLTAVSTKMAVFWVVAPFYQTTQRYNPEDSHLQENLCRDGRLQDLPDTY
jgi:hypothetical protein